MRKARSIISWRWLFRAGLALVAVFLTAYVPMQACGPGGVAHVLEMRHELQKTQEKNLRVAQQNERLRFRVKALRDDKKAIERVAREELGLVHAGDLIFEFER